MGLIEEGGGKAAYPHPQNMPLDKALNPKCTQITGILVTAKC